MKQHWYPSGVIFGAILIKIVENHRKKKLNKRIANDNDLSHFGIKVDCEYPHKHIGDIQYKANEGDVYWAVRDYWINRFIDN